MAIQYHNNGHTLRETSVELGIAVSTLARWKKQLSEKGNLEKAPLERNPRKFPDEKLKMYVKENPFATLKEIADEFEGSVTGAFDALKRLKITLKKGLPHTQNEVKRNEKGSVSSRYP